MVVSAGAPTAATRAPANLFANERGAGLCARITPVASRHRHPVLSKVARARAHAGPASTCTCAQTGCAAL